MKNPKPTFPPLLSGYPLKTGKDPFNWTCVRADKGKLGAGDLIWSEDQANIKFALAMEPEVAQVRCCEMLYLLMVAFGDASGALCPPEISIQYKWPNCILMNGASIGSVDLRHSEKLQDGVPQWMVLGIDINLKPDTLEMNPGEQESQTTFWDEGCGHISATQLIESTARHTVNWIHTWSEDGFKPVHDAWIGRLFEKSKTLEALNLEGEFVGMDENGNALTHNDGQTNVFSTYNALKILADSKT